MERRNGEISKHSEKNEDRKESEEYEIKRNERAGKTPKKRDYRTYYANLIQDENGTECVIKIGGEY